MPQVAAELHSRPPFERMMCNPKAGRDPSRVGYSNFSDRDTIVKRCFALEQAT